MPDLLFELFCEKIPVPPAPPVAQRGRAVENAHAGRFA